MPPKEDAGHVGLKLLFAMCDAVDWSRNVVVDPVYAAPQYGIFLPKDRLARHVEWLKDRGYIDVEIDSPMGVAVSQAGLDEAKAWKARSLDAGSAPRVCILGAASVAREGLASFLREEGLEPMAEDASAPPGPPSLDALRAAIERARAAVVMLTPAPQEGSAPLALDPRLLLEAGIALGAAKDRTVFVGVGAAAEVAGSALGVTVLHFDGGLASRHALRTRLEELGCTPTAPVAAEKP